MCLLYFKASSIMDKTITKMGGEKILQTIKIDHFYFNNSKLIISPNINGNKGNSMYFSRYPHETLTEKPIITIFFVSCGRSIYLYQTVQKLLDHIIKYEKNLKYELSWLDQTTLNRSDIQSRFRFNKRFLYDKSIGIEKAIHNAFLNCDTKYILILEEDWLLRDEVYFPFITESLDIMESNHPNIYGVLLREEYFNPGRLTNLTIKNDKLNKAFNGFTHDKWEFMYTNGATLYKMSTIKEFIRQKGAGTEPAFSLAAKSMNTRYFVNYWNEKYHFSKCSQPILVCSQIFKHIGIKTTQRNSFQQCAYGRSFE